MNGYLSSARGDAALAAFLQANQHVLLSATYSGSSYTLQIDQMANAGTTTFNGVGPAYSDTTTIMLTKNGVLAARTVGTSYYLLNSVMTLGDRDSRGSPYAVLSRCT